MLVLNDLLIVKPDPKPTQTEGGIALPDQAQEPPRHGIVRFASSGAIEAGVEVGNRIYYPHYAAIEIGTVETLEEKDLVKIDIKEAWFVEEVQ